MLYNYVDLFVLFTNYVYNSYIKMFGEQLYRHIGFN